MEGRNYDDPEAMVSKPWYKHWGLKLAIFILIAGYIASSVIGGNMKLQKSDDLVLKAETLILENNIPAAMDAIRESEELDPDHANNKAFDLHEKLNTAQDNQYIRERLTNMSDADFELLKAGQLTTAYIDHEGINKILISRMMDRSGDRAKYIEAKIASDAAAAAEARKKKIEAQFNEWDGSHANLTRAIKEAMNDPKSYDHIETKYLDKGDFIIVRTTFRGKNAFGAVVKNAVTAKITLDGDIIEMAQE